MTNKNIFIAIALLVAVFVVGYFFFPSFFLLSNDNQNHGSVQGKININVVCDEALAYMSFPDGKSADKFLVDCKEGKHPEVIEQYKVRMGLGAGVAI